MTVWKAILLIYDSIDVTYPRRWRFPKRFSHRLPDQEVADAIMSFEHFPALVANLTAQSATVENRVVRAKRPLSSLTRRGKGMFWPSPDDTRQDIDLFAPLGTCDSVFVFWPQSDLGRRRSIPSGGWGLGMGGSKWSNGATYAAVGNAPSFAWRIPKIGEVWLHEWLHGVCAYFQSLGHVMPFGDADGGSSHGYVQSETTGWTDYYRDLMNGRVMEEGQPTGIQSKGWLDQRQPYGNITPYV
jgi:hypothetical protein